MLLMMIIDNVNLYYIEVYLILFISLLIYNSFNKKKVLFVFK